MQTTKGFTGYDANGNKRNIIPEIDKINTTLSTFFGLDKLSWETIGALADEGKLSEIYKIGDEKKIILTTGEVLTLVVIGFNHDDKTSGGKANVTFGLKNLMAPLARMNPTDTNVGGWEACEMRTSILGETVLSRLPADLRALIKPVNKKTSMGDQSSTIITSSDTLFLLSEVELRGAAQATRSFPGEGEQYDYYKNKTNTELIKQLSNGAGDPYVYWHRSPYALSPFGFCICGSNGVTGATESRLARGVCFAFCV